METNIKLEQEIMNVCNNYLQKCNTTDRFKKINVNSEYKLSKCFFSYFNHNISF